jgi:creatine kinase
MVDQAVLDKLEAGYAKLAASDSKSLLKKYLTKEVFDNLKTKKTPTFGSSLLDVIQSGKLKLLSNNIMSPASEGVS